VEWRGFVVGSVAQWLGKKADPNRTHKWTCYVRGPANEDLSYFIRKVVFQLHSSFEKPKRDISRNPFEVVEYGWGEFEIRIRIYFQDQQEKSIELFHHLKLFHSDGGVSKRPVVSERYDEIVFENSSESFVKKLQKFPQNYNQILPHPSVDSHLIADEEDYQIISVNQKRVRDEIRKVKELCEQYDSEIRKLAEEVEVRNPGIQNPFIDVD